MEVPVLTTELPRIISVGVDILDSFHSILKDLKTPQQVVLVHDKITWDIAAKGITNQLEEKKIDVHPTSITSATVSEADRISNLCAETNPDFIIGVGGGSVIDVAKYAGTTTRVPFISVPTSAAHDGIASMRASLFQGSKKKSFEAKTPLAVIADLRVIATAPYRFLAAGSGDAIANKTAVLDWELAHRIRGERIGEYPTVLSDMTAEMIIRDAELIRKGDLIAAKIVTKALITSSMAMCIAGSTRPASGSEHLFSHALDQIAEKPALHGEQCGVGTILMMYLHGGDWMRIRNALKTIGAPTTARELGIPAETIIQAMLMAHKIRPERFTILGTQGITEEAAINAAEKTGVI